MCKAAVWRTIGTMNRDEYDQMFRLEEEHWWFVARRHLLTRAVQRFPPASLLTPRFLDVGCGTGGTLKQLQPFGDVVGLDMESLALAYCKQRGIADLVLASATALPFADGTFSAVVALDVLEHIPDDHAAAAEIARVIAPGGMFYLTVPAYRSLWSSHDVALMHQRRYVAPEIARLLSKAGLEVVHLTYTVSFFLPLVWAVRTLRRLLSPNAAPKADVALTPPAVNRLLRHFLENESALALKTPLPFGLTVFAVARKRE